MNLKKKDIFIGNKYLKFEKYPHYTKGNFDHYLRTILNLGFTKLVQRIEAKCYTDEVIDLAERCFAIVSPILRGNFHYIDDKVFEEFNQEKKSFLQLYCYTDNGDLVGSLDDIYYFLNYDCASDPDNSNVLYSRLYDGYIGFSHRAAQLFQIGDALFDENWEPSSPDTRNVENIPFRQRGYKYIENLDEARQAAINFAQYMS